MRGLFCIVVLWSATLSAANAHVPNQPLEPVPFSSVSEQLRFDKSFWSDRQNVLRAVDRSLSYIYSPAAERAYAKQDGILSRSEIARSLERFRVLLLSKKTVEDFRDSIYREFRVYRSRGQTGQGDVKFTGYFRPTYQASLRRTEEFKYPIFGVPRGFPMWRHPHPTRVELEGYDGLGNRSGPLGGTEIAFLRTRYEAYMIHVQGSAVLEFQDGRRWAVGFAQATDYPFQGIPKEFLQKNNIRWREIGQYFERHPEDLNAILARNNRFIFFRVAPSTDPIGALGVPVVAERSIATDKAQMPAGALALISAPMPTPSQPGEFKITTQTQFVLDHDAGSAIKGPGRVDVFMGTGAEAGRRADHISGTGHLYYLVLR